MAGLFEDIGEFFSGDKQRAAEQEQQRILDEQKKQAEKANTAAQGYETQSNTLTGQSIADLGTSAADQMRLADAAAREQAGRDAQMGSIQAIRNQLIASRGAGLNRGQSALMSGKVGGDVYTNQYLGGLESGRNQYNQNIQQRSNLAGQTFGQGATKRNQGLSYNQLAQGGANQQQGQAVASGAAGGATLGGLVSGVGGLLSDEDQKENIRESDSIDSLMSILRGGSLDKVADSVKPVDYNYKEGSGEDPGMDRSGIIAQDLEKSPLKGVVENTPKGKMVNTDKLEGANLNLIIQLVKRIADLQDQIDSQRQENG